MNLRALFEPRAVAVVGSTSPGKLGAVLVGQLVAGGWPATYVVNPKGRGIGDVPGYRTVAEIEAPIDLAVIASPAASVVDVLGDCGAAGVGAAVVLTAGFSEAGNVAGERTLTEVARRWGIRVVGPNCAGIVNTDRSLYPTLETRPPSGPVALVSQSGALGGAVLSWADEQGVGFSKFVSYGNGADLTDVDFIEYLRTDDASRVVCLYIETVSDGRAFLSAARRLSAVKPLIVIKSGRSEAGGRATLSHTGSMAGSDAVCDAALRQTGALRVDGIEEMFDLCRGLVCGRRPGGPRVAIVTNSGGPGVLTADRAAQCGLSIPPPSDALRARLAARLPAFCGLENPFDLTVQGTEEDYRETLADVLAEYDAAVAINVCTPYLHPVPLARGVSDGAQRSEKPVFASFMAGRAVAAGLPVLAGGGVPNFATGERAVEALGRMAALAMLRTTEPPPADDEPTGRLPGTGPILEPMAMDWLEAEGLPVVSRTVARTASAAIAAWEASGGPVAMKVVADGIVHKSDVGGVVLNLDTADEVRAAFARLHSVAGDDFSAVLVVPMIEQAVEVLVGCSRDPQFGPIIAVALGGVYTEILRDMAIRVAPIGRAAAAAAIAELAASAILTGTRGRTPCDVEALADLVASVSQLPFRYPDLEELDLNPVFVRACGLAIGDARLVRRAASEI